MDYLVIALGAYSQKLFNENNSIFKKIQKFFLELDLLFLFSSGLYKKINTDNHVYRTLNRGNACGFHVVPLNNNGFYFGASSTVTDKEEFYPRLSSVRVLSRRWKINSIINFQDINLI